MTLNDGTEEEKEVKEATEVRRRRRGRERVGERDKTKGKGVM